MWRQVYIPPIDKEEVLKELRALLADSSPEGDFQVTMPAIAKVPPATSLLLISV